MGLPESYILRIFVRIDGGGIVMASRAKAQEGPPSARGCSPGSPKKILFCRHELRAVVDGAALAVCRHPAEDTFDPHPDLRLFGQAGDLSGEPRPLVELDDREDVRGGVLELVACRPDHRVGDDRSLAVELVVDDLAAPPAVGAERPGREEVPPAGRALCPDEVIPLRDLSPEP